MIQLEQIQEFFEQLAPASDDVAAVVQTGEQSWAVGYDDETIVSFEFVPEQDKLVLSIDLGRPAEHRLLETYGALLNFNLLWRETGGVKMAMGDGAIVQLFELNAVGLTLGDLRNVIGNFVEKARVFRRFIAGELQSGESPGFDVSLRV